MKNFTKLIIGSICLLTLILNPVKAQNFSGIATYHSASSMKRTKMAIRGGDGKEIELSEDMQKQLNKAMQKEYTLKFNVSESTWKEVESLEAGPTNVSSGGMQIAFSGGGGGLLYKNTGESRYEEESEVFGKPFLIKDKLKTYEWELTGETKKIGEYNCQKAVYTKIVDRQTFSFGGDDSEENAMKAIKDTVTVTAWYTPDIPVTHGPDNYWGLPGLILEVNNGATTIICSKVVLNPAEGVKLEKPAKGKSVTKAEFTQIQLEKVAEMGKKFSKGGGGVTFKKIGN